MVVQDDASGHASLLRCDHCGRAVQETQHTRMAYTVDYYSLHTGPVETCSLVVDDGERRVTFQKLLHSEEVVTCVDCYRRSDVQRERESRFRSESVGAEGITEQ